MAYAFGQTFFKNAPVQFFKKPDSTQVDSKKAKIAELVCINFEKLQIECEKVDHCSVHIFVCT